MKAEPTSTKLQKEKQANPKVVCLWWKYDDGTFGSMVFNKDSQTCANFKHCESRAALNEQLRKCNEKGMKTKRLKFHVGLAKNVDQEIFGTYFYTDVEYLQSGVNELQKMISGYEKDGSQFEILSLLSLVLSGYVARIYLKDQAEESVYFSRAPVVRIRKHSRDLCGGFEHLQQIAHSLIVDTARPAKLVPCNPSVIPYKKRVKDIDGHAYAQYHKDKILAPTLYRDTAVLIHCGFFKEKPVHDFVDRNRWCTVLLFNLKKVNWPCLFAEVDMDNMGLPVWNWDPVLVHHLIEQFVTWLTMGRAFGWYQKEWKDEWQAAAEASVHRYNLATVSTGQKIKQGSEWDLACLQVAAVKAFLSFLHTNEILDDESRDHWLTEWISTLLPGSCIQDTSPKAAETDITEKNTQRFSQVFEDLLQKIITYNDGEKLCTDSTQYKDIEDLDMEKDPWAFLAVRKQSKADPQVPIMKIRYEELRKLAVKFGFRQKEWSRQCLIEKALLQEQKEHGDLNYIHAVDNIYLKLGKKKSHTGITLKINEMDFLSEELRKELVSRISGGK